MHLPAERRRRLLPLLAVPLLVVAVIAATGSGGSAAPARKGPGAVTIEGFAFAPATIEVAVGTTVTWTNEDTAAHTVLDDAGTFEQSAVLEAGDAFEHTYAEPGSYEYRCGLHETMRGTVVVG